MQKALLFLFTAVLLGLAGTSHAQNTRHVHPFEKYLQKGARLAASLAARGVKVNATVAGRSITHYWDNSQWRGGTVSTYTYNAQGKPTQIIYSDSATNVPEEKEILTYNAQGLVTEYIQQAWSGSAYVNSNREVSTYDAQGRETLYLTYDWRNNAWVAEDGSRSTNTYNAAGVLISQTYEELLNPSANLWGNGGRTLFTVDANNQWIEAIEQTLRNGTYVNDERTHNITWYNWTALQPSYFEFQEWSNGGWVDTDRTTITFQPNGSYVEVQQKKQPNGTWLNDDRYTLTIDANGNVTLDQGENWATNAWTINYSDRYLLSYTSANVLRRSAEQSFSVDTRAYVNRRVTTYGSFITLAARRATGLEATASVYPNPTTGTATFQLAGLTQSGPLRAEVLNTLGQVVRTLELRSQQGAVEQVVDLRQQPGGLYLVRLHTAEGIVVKQVVKQ